MFPFDGVIMHRRCDMLNEESNLIKIHAKGTNHSYSNVEYDKAESSGNIYIILHQTQRLTVQADRNLNTT